MSDIFLSYASEDRERVRPLAEALMSEGWSVFWDRAIPVGKTWQEVLEEELDAVRSLLVVWSQNSIKSKWVREEANEGLRKELPLFPVLLDGVLPPLGFRDIQAADFSRWDGAAESAVFQTLARDIKRTLSPLSGPEPAKLATPEPEPTGPEPLISIPAEPPLPKTPKQPRKRGLALLIGVTTGLALLLGLWLFIPSVRTPTHVGEAEKPAPLVRQPEKKLPTAESQREAEKPPPLEKQPEKRVSPVESQPVPKALQTITISIGMKFVLIPAGSFQMGSPINEPDRNDNERQHQVTISRPFYLQTTEVTQGQWREVMGNNPSHFKECGQDCPAETVSWNEAQEFISKLNRMEHTDKYRLPTEAEWEFACRAGSTSEWSFGDDDAKLGEYAWHKENSGHKTHPVAQKKPNAWGLYDMHGNVWEWCQDWYGEYPAGAVIDPKGPPSGRGRVLRGGSWDYDARNARSAGRDSSNPDYRIDNIGFRVARAL